MACALCQQVGRPLAFVGPVNALSGTVPMLPRFSRYTAMSIVQDGLAAVVWLFQRIGGLRATWLEWHTATAKT
jgi:hypothetical protein